MVERGGQPFVAPGAEMLNVAGSKIIWEKKIMKNEYTAVVKQENDWRFRFRRR